MAKHLQFDNDGTGFNANCVACEELFADAIDNLLSPADQFFFEQHLRTCTACAQSFTDAQRGAAWLELLKDSRPEPSATLLERILAETSGTPANRVTRSEAKDPCIATPPATVSPNVLPFIPRPVSRLTRFTRLAMEPRLAMTAAMAFFSIALTLNLLGVRLDRLKAADLSPTNLKQTYFQANATAVRFYDNLRVVRVLESRVDDMRQANSDSLLPTEPQAAPARNSAPTPDRQPQSAPDQHHTPHGSSRRESPRPSAPQMLSAQLRLATEPLRRPRFLVASVFWSLKREAGRV